LSKSEKEHERELFRRLADGNMAPNEFSAVEQRLLTDAGFRERYIRAIDIEGGLYEASGLLSTGVTTVVQVGSKMKLFWIVAAGTAIFYCVAAWLLLMSSAARPNARNVASLPSSQTPVATVTVASQLEESLVTSFEPGMLAIPGVLKIDRGQIQLEFLNGTQLNVEGPVELHLLSVDSATLISGKAAVRVASGSQGFVLNTPDASIANSGAEYAVAADKHGENQIHVVSGEITVSLLDKNGNVSRTSSVTKKKSVRVNRNPVNLEPIDAPAMALPKIQTQIPALPRIRTRHCNILPFSR
jgi:hypothetical protein